MIKKSQALSLNCKSNFAHETALFEISEMWLRSFWWIFVHRLNCTQYCTICAMISSNKSKQKKTVKCWISVSTFSSRSFVFIRSFQQRLTDFVQRRRNTRGHVLVCLNLVLLRILGVDLQTDLSMYYHFAWFTKFIQDFNKRLRSRFGETDNHSKPWSLFWKYFEIVYSVF